MPIHKKRKAVKHKSRTKAKKATRRRRTRRKVVTSSSRQVTVGRKRKTRKRKRTVRRGQRVKVVHVVAGKRRRRRAHTTVHRRSRPRKRRVIMAGTRRTRSVGKSSGSMGTLLAVGIGALAVYLLTKKSTTTPTYQNLPPLIPTNNYQRNQQQDSIVQYALAASLGIDAISKLISSLNNSSDNDVQNIYDHVNTTGTLPDTVYV